MNIFFHPETENYKYWTQEEETILESMVLTGQYSFKDIGKVLDRTAQSCQNHSLILGLNNKYIRKIYNHNESFWQILNPLNCYWAGFGAADCNIKQNKRGVV